ncbi:hypothetical protein V8B55DRAFT_1601498 [Mucor lusitanicus]
MKKITQKYPEVVLEKVKTLQTRLQLVCQSKNLDWKKVQNAFRKLEKTNNALRKYDNPTMMAKLKDIVGNAQKSKVIEVHSKNPTTSKYSEYILPSDDVAPSAGKVTFDSKVAGQDVGREMIKYILFPHLYTNGQGYYSMVNRSKITDNVTEAEGGIAVATMAGQTLKEYAKNRLLIADRRFARDHSWIFFMVDLCNQHDIQSANRHVVSTGRRLTREAVLNNDMSVPSTIKSSIAYKRKHSLDLYTMFQHYGAPQLFSTSTCDDNSDMYQNSTQGLKPWEDPVIKGPFANMIDGIKAYSYVLEEQARGLPHVHTVLRSDKYSAKELLDQGIIQAHLPDKETDTDLYQLVQKLQTHHDTYYCSPKYKDPKTTGTVS